jgi:hypothetical protein
VDSDTEVEGIEEDVEGYDNDFGIHMDMDDDVYDDDHGVPEMIGELFAAAEADGEAFLQNLCKIWQHLP